MTVPLAFVAILFALPLSRSSPADSAYARNGSAVACSILKQKYPSQTLFANSTAYQYETTTTYWSTSTYASPACVFVPRTAQQVSYAVTTFTLTSSKFAIRGGGHMAIAGYNNIDSGVLLSTSNLTTISLSADRSVVSLGPGLRWNSVYWHLSQYGLAAVGGRQGEVGVPGLLLGGGVSFYSNQHGFASDNVVEYECVLSSGKIVMATADNSYSDLFWALKGGGNSFCLLTRVALRTVPSPYVNIGNTYYDASQASQYLSAVYNFGAHGSQDLKAAVIPSVIKLLAQNATTYQVTRFYDSETDDPAVFENFTTPKMTRFADSYTLQTLGEYYKTAPGPGEGNRDIFYVIPSIVSEEALEIIHDGYFSRIDAAWRGTSMSAVVLTFQPITKEFIRQGMNKGGNPQGIDISKGPYFWTVVFAAWTDAADDDKVFSLVHKAGREVETLLKEKSLQADYHYMNDAGKGQPVFQSYPPENLARLKAIRQKYDPLQVYTDLMPGGWKVLHA